MKRDQLLPSNYLKASDFPRPEVVTIKKVYQDFIGQGADREFKTFIEFAEKDKPCVVNKTNVNFCFDNLADDTDRWIGKQVMIETPRVEFQGKSAPAIRFARAPITEDVPY